MTVIDFAKMMGTSLFAVAAFSYYVAHIAEKGASETSKRRLTSKFKSLRLTPGARSAFSHFLFAADRYFGNSIFSWKALRRSVVLSLSWVLLILALCLYMYPNYRSWLGDRLMGHLILKSALWLLFASLLIDFLSVCVTRALVRWSLPRSKFVILGIAVADIAISIVLFYLLFNSAKLIVTPGSFPTPAASLSVWTNLQGLPVLLQTLNDLTSDMLRRLPDGTIKIVGGLNTEIVYAFPEGIVFFSSLLTSVWMWLYVTAYWVMITAVKIDRVKAFIEPHLNIEREPFFAIAYAIFVVAALASGIATALFSILRWWAT